MESEEWVIGLGGLLNFSVLCRDRLIPSKSYTINFARK